MQTTIELIPKSMFTEEIEGRREVTDSSSAFVADHGPIVRGLPKREVRAQKNYALNAHKLSGASFLSRTAQDEILLASLRLGSSYSPKTSHCQKLDFLRARAQITAAVPPAGAQNHKEIGP